MVYKTIVWIMLKKINLPPTLYTMTYTVVVLMVIAFGCRHDYRESNAMSPCVLGEEEKKFFIDICKRMPPTLLNTFEFSDFPKDEEVFLQAIVMPSKKTLLILSGLGIAGLVVFDENRQIVQVLNWGAYLRGQFPLYVLDKAYYRLEQDDGAWILIVEYHGITDRRDGEHYLWQFRYGPNLSGSSKRYRLKEVY